MKLVLTCEHAGNIIPGEFIGCFNGKEEVLYTHRALDIGVHDLAQYVSEKLEIPVLLNEISRLVIEFNRSLGNNDLFSEFMNGISEAKRKSLIDNYYQPYRMKAEEFIKKCIDDGETVFHLSLHTFTPVFKEIVRAFDVGLLYDETRLLEKKICAEWNQALKAIEPDMRVKMNEPYNGADDGFTTYLRKQFAQDKYAGIELEVNQAWFISGSPAQWMRMKETIVLSLQRLLSS